MFEYKIAYLHTGDEALYHDPCEELNDLGREGWRICTPVFDNLFVLMERKKRD